MNALLRAGSMFVTAPMTHVWRRVLLVNPIPVHTTSHATHAVTTTQSVPRAHMRTLSSLSQCRINKHSIQTRLRSSFLSSFHPRNFHSRPSLQSFDDFYVNRDAGLTGRPWRCSELRLKSFEDLQRLWFVLLKERNMLLTYRYESLTRQRRMPHSERLIKVRKSMAHIKAVLGERHRQYMDATEPADSPWRKARERKSMIRKALKAKAKHPPRSPLLRQKFTHPMRKKIKYKNIKPNTIDNNNNDNSTDSSSSSNNNNINTQQQQQPRRRRTQSTTITPVKEGTIIDETTHSL